MVCNSEVINWNTEERHPEIVNPQRAIFQSLDDVGSGCRQLLVVTDSLMFGEPAKVKNEGDRRLNSFRRHKTDQSDRLTP